jgi:integrase
VREWLLELRVGGRSPQTIQWYQCHWRNFRGRGGAATLEELTGGHVKLYLASLQDRGLADTSVRGAFLTLKCFANWAAREGYPVDPALMRLRTPRVAVKEMVTYAPEQLAAIDAATPAGWPKLAVRLLLGTGMRIAELCDLRLEDLEDDGEHVFLKVRRGKGAKFRRVPVSQRLRRDLVRYINRERPETDGTHLLVKPNGRVVEVMTVTNILRRIRLTVGFPVHAHRFRHTFATEYLRNGGEMERLRRILGHTSYFMVMRYLHLDKGDLGRDFDARTPY